MLQADVRCGQEERGGRQAGMLRKETCLCSCGSQQEPAEQEVRARQRARKGEVGLVWAEHPFLGERERVRPNSSSLAGLSQPGHPRTLSGSWLCFRLPGLASAAFPQVPTAGDGCSQWQEVMSQGPQGAFHRTLVSELPQLRVPLPGVCCAACGQASL
jgi:hypothetical protein